ncbi:hypothetical protein [Bdellovibrio sp. HCB337]|uniref:hypothetical protein n=1 Tax=Bdellovibrio sp. HCB337 TaxID=3394358 RepID=UPI0039A6FBB8
MSKYTKLFLVVLPLTVASVLSFNNCGRYGALNEGTEDTASLGSTGPLPEQEEVNSEKLGLPFALLSAEQTLVSMMKVTNTTVASNALLTEYSGRYGALAAGNDLSMMNGPLMLGSTSLAGEVCNSLLTQEKALADGSRNFFNGINFTTGVASVSDVAYNTAIRGMARSFWGRLETTEEQALMATFKTDFINALAANVRTQAASTNNLILGTCAAMLSSLDAISY